MVTAEKKGPTTWWEELGIPFRGKFADRAILKPDSPEERRIQRLRQAVLPVSTLLAQRLSAARARLVTESYRQSEGEHPAIRRARAIAHVFENIPIPLVEGQLLVGASAAEVCAVEVFPELMNWRESAEQFFDSFRYYHLTEVDEREFRESIVPYWAGRGRGDYAQRELETNQPDALEYTRHAVSFSRGTGGPLYHTLQDFNSIVTRGLDDIKAEMLARIGEIDGAAPKGHEELERRNLYRSMLIVADGIIAYSERAADLLQAEAARLEYEDNERASELRKLAAICRRAPRRGASTWWEAIQSLHLLRMGTVLAEGGGSHCVGRFDQYMLPFLERDLESGNITLQKAQEILECFFVKWNEVRLYSSTPEEGSPGMRLNDKLTIGGIDGEGYDATNRLSDMCLEAHAHVHLNDPNISVRMHRQTPDDFLLRSLEVVRLGGGLPQFISDEAIIPTLMGACGLSLEDARNYADIGCQENASDPNLPPHHDTSGYTNTGWFNLVKPIELALWNGVNSLNGKPVGPRTGDPRTFKTMDEFVAAVRAQYEYGARMNAAVCTALEYSWAKYYPVVYHDLLHSGPRQTGIDFEAGGSYYNWSGSLGVGLATAGDSLSAINHLIYKTRSVTWDELLDALGHDWSGAETLRQRCIRAPKFGAADPAADRWTRLVTRLFADSFEKCRSPKGGKIVAGLASMATFVKIGNQTGTTPDGRYSAERVSDSTAPSRYAPALGPTAAHLSNARGIDSYRMPNGVTFNQRFSSGAVASERDLAKWADLLRTFIAEGGQSVQYTVVDREMLLDAREHPERYRDLFVRVGGYSALFVELSREIQDSIIARAEQGF